MGGARSSSTYKSTEPPVVSPLSELLFKQLISVLGWLVVFSPSFPSDFPSVGHCLGRRVHKSMVLFTHTLMVSFEAWDKADPVWHVPKGPIFSCLKGHCMGRGRTTALTIRLTPAQRRTLLVWQRSTTISAGRARRGRIIVLVAQGMSISDVAATVGISRRFVYKWVQRFLEQGIEGLTDKPGRGYRRVPRQPVLTEPHAVSA